MSIFDKNRYREITRRDFKETLRKAPARIPGGGGKMYSWQERVKMEKEIFPWSRYKSHISEGEAKMRMREMVSERQKARTKEERLKVDRKLRFLKDVTGVKPY